jgi:uncharacterized protein (DUF1501 family)
MSTTTRMTRRELLAGQMTRRTAPGPKLLFRPEAGPAGDVLVCLFLRGGMDGMHVVVPHGDSDYYRQRPSIAIARPDDRRAAPAGRTVDLDGYFGLHPTMAALREAFQAGQLAIVHACGTPDSTRSHFEAMETMERGVDDGSTASTGWLGRHLATLDTGNRSPLRSIALADVVPQSLQGALGAIAVSSLTQFRLAAPAAWSAPFRSTLAALYTPGEDTAAVAGRETLALLAQMERLDPATYRPTGGATYPKGEFGDRLKQIAQLVKAELGLEVACLDLGGWDSHVGQAPLIDGNMRDLAGGLAAFRADLGEKMNRVTVVAMSEFGRRAYENTGLGTDHGRATAMFLLGGGIRGGKVYRQWPGLAPGQLEGPGDLRVTTDYRDVLGEVVRDRLLNPRLEEVFPNHRFAPRGIVAGRSGAAG